MFFNGKEELFGITGPLGKGLGLTPSSKGVHIMFTAGTGILPFIDLIARMIFQQFDIMNPGDERFHEDFKLVAYIAFHSKKDIIGLPLIEGLLELCKK